MDHKKCRKCEKKNYRQNVIRVGHNYYNLGFQQKEKEDNFLIK